LVSPIASASSPPLCFFFSPAKGNGQLFSKPPVGISPLSHRRFTLLTPGGRWPNHFSSFSGWWKSPFLFPRLAFLLEQRSVRPPFPPGWALTVNLLLKHRALFSCCPSLFSSLVLAIVPNFFFPFAELSFLSQQGRPFFLFALPLFPLLGN